MNAGQIKLQYQRGSDLLYLRITTRLRKKTIAGCKLQVEWKYEYMQWLDLKDIKASYPLELSECGHEYDQ